MDNKTIMEAMIKQQDTTLTLLNKSMKECHPSKRKDFRLMINDALDIRIQLMKERDRV